MRRQLSKSSELGSQPPPLLPPFLHVDETLRRYTFTLERCLHHEKIGKLSLSRRKIHSRLPDTPRVCFSRAYIASRVSTTLVYTCAHDKVNISALSDSDLFGRELRRWNLDTSLNARYSEISRDPVDHNRFRQICPADRHAVSDRRSIMPFVELQQPRTGKCFRIYEAGYSRAECIG